MHIVQIFNKERQITSKKDTAMSRQLKFLMLASELSSRGKKITWTRILRAEKRVVKKQKIPLEELKDFVEAHPDAFLREIAAHFDCAVPSVWAALKQIKVTLKKDD